MMAVNISVNNDMLTWAIARAGYELPEFAEKYPRISDWLSGAKQPTVKQLEDFSNKVYLPFGYLFLPKPPNETISFPFFRTGRIEGTNRVNLNVYDTIIDLQRRQQWLIEYLQELDNKPLPYVGRFNSQTNPMAVVQDIRATLGLEVSWTSGCPTWEDALDTLVRKIEEIGIIVVFNGIVGNNTHRVIPVEECRGFVMVDEYVPFMFVNGADAKAAQLFTIVHELAHVWLGRSAGFDFRQLMPSDDPTEQLCDQVAAEFLVPEALLRVHWTGIADIRKLAAKFKVSKIVIARRALDLGLISRAAFFHVYNTYMAEFAAKKQGQESGGNFYYTARKRVSPTFAAYVDSAVKTDKLLYRDAYKLTGLSGKTYQTFVTEHLTRT
ncbi:DNA-binding protein [Parapedobacter defluvii]|uniref:DNA-binding protein n=1 Tax=Parapedobacter defluvii TaxID=2045106 RepID=A0ABQ1MZY8_9SPHI|nr:ImmA/IrrE family metallo-endopeptidase [Parapedobacter defluvii]GGC50305.1 DNA-binding protein [Parapedobacter defluvii]